MTRYAKALLAAVLALSAWGVTAAADGHYDQIELWGLLAAIATPLGVYLVPNTPPDGEPRDPDVSETAAPAGPVLLASPAPKKTPAKKVAKKAVKR